MAGPDVVVFDLGGVLLDWDREHLYRRLIPDEAERRWFLDEIVSMEWNAELDRGLPFDVGVEQLAGRHPEHRDLILAYRDRWDEMVPGDIPGTVDVLRDLVGAGIRCLGLTNFSAETFGRIEARFGWLDLLAGIVVSGREGVVKPEQAIFDLLCRRHHVEPRRAAFVDDSAANVAAARSAGFVGVAYVSPDALRGELAALGLPV